MAKFITLVLAGWAFAGWMTLAAGFQFFQGLPGRPKRQLRDVAMPLISVNVECYAGSEAFERPRRILMYGLAYEVISATALSVEEDASSRRRRDRYEVLIEDGRRLKLIRQGDNWFVET